MCPDCADRSGEVLSWESWVSMGLPGDGATICGDYCMCVLMGEGLLREIALSEGLPVDLSIRGIIDEFGLGIPIETMQTGLQAIIYSIPEISYVADMSYGTAQHEIIGLLTARDGYDPTYVIRSLRELVEMYRGG